VASHPATLVRALQHRQAGAPSLIDSSGVDPFDAPQMASIAALTEAAAAIPVMVLPAGFDPLEAAEQAAAFASGGVRHFIPTRLDLARRLGSVVSAAVAGGMMLSEAGTGPGAINGLTKLTAEYLIARLSQMPVPKTAKVPDGHPRYV
jgi:flagellar biosynthesis protein FlhF